MTKSIVPLRKTFAKFAKNSAVNFILMANMIVTLPVASGFGLFYGLRSHTVDTWDYQVSDNHRLGVDGFRDDLSDMVKIRNQLSNTLESNKEIYMNGGADAVDIFEKRMKDSSGDLKEKATSYVQNLILSRDIHEEDYHNLGQDFKDQGFSNYSDIKLHVNYPQAASRMECHLNKVKIPKWRAKSDFDKAKSVDACIDARGKYVGPLPIVSFFLPIALAFIFPSLWGNFKSGKLEKWERLPDRTVKKIAKTN